MSDDYSYMLVKNEDKQVLKHLADMGEQLKKLKEKQLAAEAAAEAAKKEFEHYANVIIPSEMHSCGINSISLASGGSLSIKHNFYCQPNKNPTDRAIIAKWLREHNGAHIVEHDATVSAADMKCLEQQGIPFVENISVNTQKLKSFLKDGIGATSGVQQFTIDDIPQCIHFQEVTTVEINMEK